MPKAKAKPAEPKQRKSDRTREEFKAAARRVFARSGYLSAKINDITREAGKSAGTFYLYFTDKEDLLRALIEEFYAELPHNIALAGNDASDPMEAIEDGLRGYWNAYQKYQADIVGIFQAAMVDPAYEQIWREIRASGIRMTAHSIRRMQEGGTCPGVDPTLLASALCGMVEFACYNWVSRRIDFKEREIEEEEAIQALLAALRGTLSYRPPTAKPARRRTR